MSLECADNVDLTGAKTVTVAGRDLPIVPFSLRRTIALSALAPKLAGLAKGDTLDAEKNLVFVEVLRLGLSGAYPKVTVDDILDLPITLEELIKSANVIIEQAGGKKVSASEGESSAASDSAISTGTSSSPSL
jgi:hypothetical protein